MSFLLKLFKIKPPSKKNLSKPLEKEVKTETIKEPSKENTSSTEKKEINNIILPESFEEEIVDYEVTENEDEIQGITLKETNQKKDFETLDSDQLFLKQQKEILEVSTILQVPIYFGGVFLRYYRWNKEKLFYDFFENSENVCKLVGVDLTDKIYFGQESMMECNVCMEDVKGSEMMSLGCKHFFCLSCWKNFITNSINEGPSCLKMKCPFPKCKLTINEEIVSKTVDPEIQKKYEKYLIRSFVDDNPYIKWCPFPDCGRTVHIPDLDGSLTSVKCSCGHCFCFKCNLEAHSPCSCEQIKEWNKKATDESETANYLVAHTKDCPKCQRSIEKNGGCNHMVCTFCQFEFCWVCMEDWKKYHSAEQNTGGFYHCNRYKPEELEKREKLKNKDVQNARAAIEKYMHYYKRYANHSQSQKLEGKLKQLAEDKMKELQMTNKSTSWLDVEYIQKSVSQLIECRMILKYTYVYAYFMSDGPEKNLFEYLQEDLEKNTEELSGILEDSKKYNRDQILNTTKLANIRLNHLLKGVEKGLIKSEF